MDIPSAPLDLLGQLLEFEFMRNAFVAGAAVALLAGVTGYFVVLRGETYAGHTLSIVGFPGAAGAVLLGIPQLVGLVAICAASSLGIAALGRVSWERHGQSAAIGSIQALALALGFLFTSLYRGLLNGVTGLLFGSFLSISQAQVIELIGITAVVLAVMALIGRRFLYLSVDPEAAAAAGVPVGAISIAFLLLLGLSVAATTLITGALLVFAMLVLPAAAAQQLTNTPAAGIAISVALGLANMWLSLSVAYLLSDYPIGFFVTTFGLALYLACRGVRRLRP